MKNAVHEFYEAFEALDGDKMADLYHDDVIFSDPAFGVLHGERAKNMWRMLCKSQRDKDFKIHILTVNADEKGGMANWEAFYEFSKTGRRIHNRINSTLLLKEGKIIRHDDKFDLYRWARQALGIPGLLIGWTPFFQRKLIKTTHAMLDKFIKNSNLSDQNE